MRLRRRSQRIMKVRVHHPLGALALLGIWVAFPAGRVLGSSTGLVLFMTALGLLAGASAGWLVQHMLHRPMTRQMLTGAGWAVSVLLVAALSRDAIAGRSGLAHFAVIVGYSGWLAWSVRLLLAPVQDHAASSESSRNLLVGIKHITRASDEVAPRAPGRRMTPVSSILHGVVMSEPATEAPKSKGQKAG